MHDVNQWKRRVKELAEEGRKAELHSLARAMLRLAAPMYDEPSQITDVVHIAERLAKGEACSTHGMDHESAERRLESMGCMTHREWFRLRESGSSLVQIAIGINHAHIFAQGALQILSSLIDAHLEECLGTAGSVARVSERFRPLFTKKGERSSLLHRLHPDAAKKLGALLEGPAAVVSKTTDRLRVFHLFTLHNSFRSVASVEAKRRGEPNESPDHTGPLYKVRKLGESLGIQLTCPSSDSGRARTVLTPAGEALADWISHLPKFAI